MKLTIIHFFQFIITTQLRETRNKLMHNGTSRIKDGCLQNVIKQVNAMIEKTYIQPFHEDIRVIKDELNKVYYNISTLYIYITFRCKVSYCGHIRPSSITQTVHIMLWSHLLKNY